MYEVKDSGEREQFDSGMVRDTAAGKTLWHLVADGPMLARWARHLTAGAEKYSPGNWLMAEGDAEMNRFLESAFRHFVQWYWWRRYGVNLEEGGDRSVAPREDHGAAVLFNINGAEYVAEKMAVTD